jgi:hypothetical protein
MLESIIVVILNKHLNHENKVVIDCFVGCVFNNNFL